MIDRLLQTRVAAGILCLFVAGCGSTSDFESSEDEEEVGAARQGQICEGLYYSQYEFDLDGYGNVFDILVIGPNAIGNFSANTEYYYVKTSYLSELGGNDLVVHRTDYSSGSPPSLSGDQEFTQPVNLTWTSFSSDPVSGGALYTNGDVHLRIKTTSGEISGLTWYQSTAGTPANVDPQGTWDATSGSVGARSGQTAYYIDATIN